MWHFVGIALWLACALVFARMDPAHAQEVTTTLPPDTTTMTTVPATTVEITGFAGDGLAIPVGFGLLVFSSVAALVISFRTRRA